MRRDWVAKRVGEARCHGATPAAVDAVIDALAPLGVKEIEMPITRERVWRAIRGARALERPSST